MMIEHKHLLVQARFLARGRIPQYYESWMATLIDDLDMKKLTEPKAVASYVKGNRGITCFCMITTSHIVLHTWEDDHPGLLQLDVYSCKDFKIKKVINRIKDLQVDEHTIQYKFLDREYGFVEVEGNEKS